MAALRRTPRTTRPPLAALAPETDESHEFLSPDWIHRVIAVVEAAKRSDVYFGGLVADLSFRVAYVVGGLPEVLKKLYGNLDHLVICVDLERGMVQKIEFSGELPAEPVQLVVTTNYKVAKKLYLGDLSPASSMMTGRLRAKPASGFLAWSKLAPKSLVTASRVLRTARKISTSFNSKTHTPRATPR